MLVCVPWFVLFALSVLAFLLGVLCLVASFSFKVAFYSLIPIGALLLLAIITGLKHFIEQGVGKMCPFYSQ
jgi:hypothetical protein